MLVRPLKYPILESYASSSYSLRQPPNHPVSPSARYLTLLATEEQPCLLTPNVKTPPCQTSPPSHFDSRCHAYLDARPHFSLSSLPSYQCIICGVSVHWLVSFPLNLPTREHESCIFVGVGVS